MCVRLIIGYICATLLEINFDMREAQRISSHIFGSSCNIADLCSGSAWFDCQLGHWISDWDFP